MLTESSVEILTINSRLPSTNNKPPTINTGALEENKAMKMLPLPATYPCHPVVLAPLPATVLLLLAASDKDSNTFLYYPLATKDLSQDGMAF